MSVHRSHRQHPDVTGFAESLFALLPRTDQRRWAEVYLRGLLTVPGRKTLQRLAETVPGSRTASQCLQQFINASPWDWAPVRQELAVTVAAARPTTAWTIGTAVIPKRGEHSVGVHRRFVPKAGRTLNCQVGLGLFLSSEEDDIPVDWEIVLDEIWRADTNRLQRARVPEDVAVRPEWAQVLDLVDRRPGGQLPHEAPVIADLQSVESADRLLAGLAHRGMDVLAQVPPGQILVPTSASPNRGASALTAEALLPSGPAQHRLPALTSLPVRLPRRDGAYRLWAHRPSPDPRAVRFYLTSLAEAGADRIVSLLRHQVRTRAVMEAMGDSFGMLDFAGRSFFGWHHHMTMTSAAYAYSRLSLSGRQTAARVTPPQRVSACPPLPAGGTAVHAGRRRSPRLSQATTSGFAD
ncbi:transposase [Streptomyces sp. A3M-1-3]|uniref:IS701 family transposase n=1 Tax=Streptomyces sp. A3M-1-3 TaxID=2962044 RepID=UPI0020B73A2C|nr:transposase [Streptomyces sp. A3M-1-3]MCP3820229.1 transposase [Streptomyces sp. A3M-1-3]